MRLWSLHPRYLDARGLVALWREALLAQAVLRGRTRGYRAHPQLARFRAHRHPRAAIATYLRGVYDEACERGYRFDVRCIGRTTTRARIAVSEGQLRYEWRHLARKLRERDPRWLRALRPIGDILPHPSFIVVPGDVADWEVGAHRRTPGKR